MSRSVDTERHSAATLMARHQPKRTAPAPAARLVYDGGTARAARQPVALDPWQTPYVRRPSRTRTCADVGTDQDHVDSCYDGPRTQHRHSGPRAAYWVTPVTDTRTFALGSDPSYVRLRTGTGVQWSGTCARIDSHGSTRSRRTYGATKITSRYARLGTRKTERPNRRRDVTVRITQRMVLGHAKADRPTSSCAR